MAEPQSAGRPARSRRRSSILSSVANYVADTLPFLGSFVGSVAPASARKARRKSLPASHPDHAAGEDLDEGARGGLRRPATARRPKRRRESSVRFGDDRNETREVTRWISKLSPSDFAKAHMGAGDDAEDDAAADAGWDAADDNGPDLADDDLLDDTTPAKRPRLSEGSNSSDIVPRRLNPSSSNGSDSQIADADADADADDVSDAGSERGSPAASESLLQQSTVSASPGGADGEDRPARRSSVDECAQGAADAAAASAASAWGISPSREEAAPPAAASSTKSMPFGPPASIDGDGDGDGGGDDEDNGAGDGIASSQHASRDSESPIATAAFASAALASPEASHNAFSQAAAVLTGLPSPATAPPAAGLAMPLMRRQLTGGDADDGEVAEAQPALTMATLGHGFGQGAEDVDDDGVPEPPAGFGAPAAAATAAAASGAAEATGSFSSSSSAVSGLARPMLVRQLTGGSTGADDKELAESPSHGRLAAAGGVSRVRPSPAAAATAAASAPAVAPAAPKASASSRLASLSARASGGADPVAVARSLVSRWRRSSAPVADMPPATRSGPRPGDAGSSLRLIPEASSAFGIVSGLPSSGVSSAAQSPAVPRAAPPAEPPRPRTAGLLRRSARRDIQRDILATLIGATGAPVGAGAAKVSADFGFSAPSAGEPAGFGDDIDDDEADFAFTPAAGLA